MQRNDDVVSGHIADVDRQGKRTRIVVERADGEQVDVYVKSRSDSTPLPDTRQTLEEVRSVVFHYTCFRCGNEIGPFHWHYKGQQSLARWCVPCYEEISDAE